MSLAPSWYRVAWISRDGRGLDHRDAIGTEIDECLTGEPPTVRDDGGAHKRERLLEDVGDALDRWLETRSEEQLERWLGPRLTQLRRERRRRYRHDPAVSAANGRAGGRISRFQGANRSRSSR